MRIFFSGKGGVGKTTMACATALYYAGQGKKTLLVSTDPASNIADVLEQPIGYGVVPVEGAPNLWATEIDPDRAVAEYKERVLNPYKEIMPEDILASLDEQLSGPCTVEIAAFDRFIDFMDVDDFETVVFDTAPTGHTLRLLALSVDWSRYIETAAKGSGQTCLGPVQAIQGAKAKYDAATAMLKDPSRTQFVFVMRPQALSVYETLRAANELGGQGIKPARLIANGVLPAEAGEGPLMVREREEQNHRIREAEERLGLRAQRVSLRPEEVKGVQGLLGVAAELYEGRGPTFGIGEDRLPGEPARIAAPDVNALFRPLSGRTKAFFFTGKGGVGKTTVSCATALALARRGHKTLLVTTDPAAHLGRVLDHPVTAEPGLVAPNLTAVHIDQVKAFHEYKDRVLKEAAETASAEMLQATAEELDSPCTEEMAAFDHFARHFEDESYDFIVLDTAPTGHTLRLLDLPFQYAQQTALAAAEAKGGGTAQRADARFQRLIARLKDPALTTFVFVFTPEATPILESHRAFLDLKNAGIHAQFLVANMVLSPDQASTPFLRRRRAMQQRYLAEAQAKFGLPVLVLPQRDAEPKGLAMLEELGWGFDADKGAA